jgi:hypothetical protein
MQIIFGNRWRHLLGEKDFWEHVGGIDISLAPSSFGQANTRVDRIFDKAIPSSCSTVHGHILSIDWLLFNKNEHRDQNSINSLKIYNLCYISVFSMYGLEGIKNRSIGIWILPRCLGCPSFLVPLCFIGSCRSSFSFYFFFFLFIFYFYGGGEVRMI